MVTRSTKFHNVLVCPLLTMAVKYLIADTGFLVFDSLWVLYADTVVYFASGQFAARCDSGRVCCSF